MMKVHPYYRNEKAFANIALHNNLLKAERRKIRRSGLPGNQKRGILDFLSTVPKNISHAVFNRGHLVKFETKRYSPSDSPFSSGKKLFINGQYIKGVKP